MLPRLLCDTWNVPALPGAPLSEPLSRDGVERVVTALTAVGAVAAATAGVLLV